MHEVVTETSVSRELEEIRAAAMQTDIWGINGDSPKDDDIRHKQLATFFHCPTL